MTKLLIVAITYFIYNFYFFRYASAVMDISPIKTRNVWLTFLVNYSVFILCTIVQLHLIINWCIFFVFLLVEVRLFCHCSYLKDSTVALTGALVGLTVNLFFRNMIAIVMQAPLAAFDNNSDLPGNAKQYPIALGFLCAGLWFLVVTGGKHNIRMREIIKDNKSLKFFFILMVSMYGYLCLNLLVYYAPGDYLVLKVWALKANAVVVIGYYLSLSFSYSMSRLERYRSENKEARMKLEEGRKEEEKLQSIAYHDPLTGCENRQQAIGVLTNALEKGESFCLCFIDLNGLKSVNDHLGHPLGDQYLTTVVETLRTHFQENGDRLFRYGGDEFILLRYGTTPGDVKAQMAEVQEKLTQKSSSSENSFSMSISYGIVESADYDDADQMIREADQRMYEHKKKLRKV